MVLNASSVILSGFGKITMRDINVVIDVKNKRDFLLVLFVVWSISLDFTGKGDSFYKNNFPMTHLRINDILLILKQKNQLNPKK